MRRTTTMSNSSAYREYWQDEAEQAEREEHARRAADEYDAAELPRSFADYCEYNRAERRIERAAAFHDLLNAA